MKNVEIFYRSQVAGRSVEIWITAEGAYEASYELEALLAKPELAWAKTENASPDKTADAPDDIS